MIKLYNSICIVYNTLCNLNNILIQDLIYNIVILYASQG